MSKIYKRLLCALSLTVALSALGYILWMQPPREELSYSIATLMSGLFVALCLDEQ